MKHTRISLESLADRFLFASEHGTWVRMTQEMINAEEQCTDITGTNWDQFLLNRQELLEEGVNE